jgi:hypothetical protein
MALETPKNPLLKLTTSTIIFTPPKFALKYNAHSNFKGSEDFLSINCLHVSTPKLLTGFWLNVVM